MEKERVIICWSGGKDSAMALYEAIKQYEVLSLLTTVTKTYDRISMHGVRRSLLARQAQALEIPVHEIFLSENSSNEEYEARMNQALLYFKEQGINSVLFGDIFLQDLRDYREKNLAKIGMKGIFPIWQRNTTELMVTFINIGFKATIVCVDPRFLNRSFAGRIIDKEFVLDLPSNVDPCGENGEFHSFVWDGPIFKQKIECRTGEVVERGWKDSKFIFCDLVEK